MSRPKALSKAEAGDVNPMYGSASRSSSGADSSRDNSCSLVRAAQAPRQGWVRALQVGDDYWFGRNGVAKNHAEAFRWYKRAADGGHIEAHLDVGRCFLNGDGTDMDVAAAAAYFRKASDANNAKAQGMLGGLLLTGYHTDRDEKAALELIRKSADAGDGIGCYWLGVCHEFGRGGLQPNDAKSVECYCKSADQNNPHAQWAMARMLRDGRGGSITDEKAAFALLSKAAAYNSWYAADVSWWHERSIRTAPDPEKALSAFRQVSRSETAHTRIAASLVFVIARVHAASQLSEPPVRIAWLGEWTDASFAPVCFRSRWFREAVPR
jgi:TPR repeat protein